MQVSVNANERLLDVIIDGISIELEDDGTYLKIEGDFVDVFEKYLEDTNVTSVSLKINHAELYNLRNELTKAGYH